MVTEGKVVKDYVIRVLRNGRTVYVGIPNSLRRIKEVVKEYNIILGFPHIHVSDLPYRLVKLTFSSLTTINIVNKFDESHYFHAMMNKISLSREDKLLYVDKTVNSDSIC